MPPCFYGDDNWTNVGGCSQACGGGNQGQMLIGTPSNCKKFRTVSCNTQSCPPSIPDGIYKEWYNTFEDGTSIVFNRDNTVVYQNCINNIFGCIANPKGFNGSITGTDVPNKVVVTYNYKGSYVYQYNLDNDTLTDLSNGVVYNKRW